MFVINRPPNLEHYNRITAQDVSTTLAAFTEMSTSDLPSLLLLPPVSYPISSATLSAAYREILWAAITKVAALQPPNKTILQVAVPCSHLYGRLNNPRSEIFHDTEKLVAAFYSLISIICAKDSVDTDGPTGVDVRLLLLSYASPDNSVSVHPASQLLCGTALTAPYISLQTLALTRRQWRLFLHVDSPAGRAVFNDYYGLLRSSGAELEGRRDVVSTSVQGAVSTKTSEGHEEAAKSSGAAVEHLVVAVGGTFDHLHAGHKLLLTATAMLLQPTPNTPSPRGRRLIVGITGDELLKNKKYAEFLETWAERHEQVVDFLKTLLSFPDPTSDTQIVTTKIDNPTVNGQAVHTWLPSADLTIECVKIEDPFGPTITDESVSALIVSGETRSGGAAVNNKRKEKGWKALEVYEVDVLDVHDVESPMAVQGDFAAKISSTAIRQCMAQALPRRHGQID